MNAFMVEQISYKKNIRKLNLVKTYLEKIPRALQGTIRTTEGINTVYRPVLMKWVR